VTKLRSWLLLLTAVALLGAGPTAEIEAPRRDAVEREKIPGTRVALMVPDGFEIARDFPGIGRSQDFTSVLVTELNVPAAIAAESVSEAALARNGVELIESKPVQIYGRPATRVDAVQKIGAISFRKWFLVLGNDTKSVMLTATTPSENEEQYRTALVQVLESAHWDEGGAPASAPVALPFQVKEAPPLRIVRSAATALVLSEPAPVKGHVTPVVTVGASKATVAVGELAGFAKTRLEETPTLTEIQIRSQGAQRLGGLPGHEIRADARDTESGRPVRVHQLLAEDGGHYYLVQGIFDAEDAGRLDPAFDAVAASFTLRPAAAGTAPAAGDAKALQR
jgi:hypothetical protein